MVRPLGRKVKLMIRLRNFVVLFALAFGVAFETHCQAQNTESVCLQYAVYYDGIDYLFLADEYNSTCTGSVADSNFWWVPAAYVPNNVPQSCPNCFGPGVLTAISKKGVIQAKADENSASLDRPFPSPGPQQKLLPANYKFGHDKSNEPLPALNEGRFQPTSGITLISSQWVQVTTKSGATIPVKLFTAQIDYAAAGLNVTDSKIPKTRIIRVGFEMTPPNALTGTPIKPARGAVEAKYSGDVKVSVDNDSYVFRVITKTPLF